MTWLRRTLALALIPVLAPPAAAQITGRPFEFSAGAGLFSYDTRARLEDNFALNGTIGYRLAHWFTVEASGTYSRTHADTLPNSEASMALASADARFNVRPADGRIVPFVIIGFGYGRNVVTGGNPEKLERGTPSLGAGALFNLFGNSHWYARAQVRDVMFKERESFEFSHHVTTHVGIHYVLGGKYKDTDLDGVREWIDRCPETPIGATVDASGCPGDADADSVLDGVDTCAATPRGCKVDRSGCPIDSDGDGVCDGLDTCAVTPQGAKVDDKGCPIDSDGDGVFDGIDPCPDTPQGAKIDDKGCPTDADGDGVWDGLDTCADTPKGAQVDAKGCETQASLLEAEMLDTGRIRLPGVTFETGKATLLPGGLAILDDAGQVLSKWPDLEVEVAGHTDAKGKAAANLKLSRDRAQAVRQALLEKAAGFPAGHLTAKGYGGDKPIASNDSEAGRTLNRRVELVVKNRSALMKAGGQRRMGAK